MRFKMNQDKWQNKDLLLSLSLLLKYESHVALHTYHRFRVNFRNLQESIGETIWELSM